MISFFSSERTANFVPETVSAFAASAPATTTGQARTALATKTRTCVRVPTTISPARALARARSNIHKRCEAIF